MYDGQAYLSRLNDKQREAATCTEGPLLILAGAGSGKTSTMTSRIAYLIEQGVSPWNILAVTFTNKAAGEMRERVEALVGQVSYMWIMTFHAMSLRMLREHSDVIGYEKNFVVYDTVDQKTLIKNIEKAQNLDSKEYPLPYVLSIISKQKELDIDPAAYAEMSGSSPKGKRLASLYEEYQRQLRANNAMDFDDLLVNALHLLQQNKEVLASYQARFRYIMVDEYQDTNHIQYELVRLLAQAHRNLCVVGDDDQCIYEWRGADISNILGFEQDFPDARVIKLEQNYRSCGNILTAAHSVIRHNRGRKEKRLWTDREAGEKITYYRAEDDKAEARYVAEEIYALQKRRGGGYDDFAVLYRTNVQSRLFEDAFKAHGIPYQILSGFSFYERKETKDMICYMRLVVNPADDLALERVINEPKRGIGPTTLAKLRGIAKVYGISLLEALSMDEVLAGFPPKAARAVGEMLTVLDLCRNERENLRIADIYDNLLVKTGYMQALEAVHTVEAEGRLENLLDFKSFIYDYEKGCAESGEEATLEGFLERVATDSDADRYDETAGKVTMMTLHSAKGLEFPVVFMPGMEDGLFPSYRAFDKQNGMEEERRLCYVGITRAREKLYMTGAAYRVLYGKGDATRESTFMREIDPRVLDGNVYRGGGRVGGRIGVDTGSADGFAAKKPARPFAYDPLAYARERAARAAGAGQGMELAVGDQVTHGKFGFGVVIDVDDRTVSVMFESVGLRKLARDVAPLTKV